MSRRPKLRTLFIAISLIILALPLAGIFLLRLYESALVRQTESSLIAQASWIVTSYKHRLQTSYPQLEMVHYGKPLTEKLLIRYKQQQKRWTPQPPVLDLNKNPVLAKPPDAYLSEYPRDDLAFTIGQQLQPLLKEVQRTTLAGIRIVDSQGTIIATTGEELGFSLLNRSEVVKALSGYPNRVLRQRISDETRPVLTSISRGTRVRIFLAHPIVIEQRIVGAVILSRTPPDIFQVLYSKRTLFAYFGFSLLCVVILLAWFTSFAITRPVQLLARQAKLASEQDQAIMPTLSHPLIYEIEQLSQALHKMVGRQNQRANYIKNFASHISHEFKTPITAIKGALELLSDHYEEMSAQEIQQFLKNIDKDTTRMQQLMSRLTELAKADVISVTDKEEDLLDLIYSVIEDYESKVSIVVTTDLKQCCTLMTKELIETIFINLIDNAYQHGGKEISISITAQGSYFIVLFADNGSGISQNNAAKVFTPFFTTARQKGGTGLGLVIIKTLMEAHQGSIELQKSKKGCSFRLKFIQSTVGKCV